MKRYVLTDYYSGMVWIDGEFSTPIEAAHAADAENSYTEEVAYTEKPAEFEPKAYHFAFAVYSPPKAFPKVLWNDRTDAAVMRRIANYPRVAVIIEAPPVEEAA